jgi:hypothetical protein
MNARGIRATEERTVLGKTIGTWRKIRERVEALALLYWSVGTRTGLNPGRFLSLSISREKDDGRILKEDGPKS